VAGKASYTIMNELKKIALWTFAGAVGVFIGVVGGWWYISRYMVVRTAYNAPQVIDVSKGLEWLTCEPVNYKSYAERRELENLAGADVNQCGQLIR
jgi:hypothetical protein